MQVNIPAATGDMGILANHVPSIEALRPGLVEVVESTGSSKKFFGALHTVVRLRLYSPLSSHLVTIQYLVALPTYIPTTSLP